MSNKPDKRVSVKLSEENTDGLKELQTRLLIKSSLPVLANAAIKYGLIQLNKGSEIEVVNHDHVQS